MRELLLLSKIELSKLFRKRNGEKRNIFLTIIMFLFIFAYVMLYEYLGMDYLNENGALNAIFPFIYVLFLFGVLVYTLPKAKGYIYSENDLIFSLPIKYSVILLSRVLSVIVINTLVALLLFVPATIIYGIFIHPAISFYIMSGILMLTVSIVPTLIALVFGQLIGYIVNKLNLKRGFETLVTLIFVFGVMYLSMNIQKIGQYLVENSSLKTDIEIFNVIVTSLNEMLYNFDYIVLVKFLLISFVSLAIYVYIFKDLFAKISRGLNAEIKGKKYVSKELNTNSIIISLIKKEFRTLIGIPIYILNSCFGMVMLLIGAIASIFYDIMPLLASEGVDTSISSYFIIFFGLAFIISMTNTNSMTISLEGKNLWIIKSLPIKTIDILKSKILFNMLIIVPISVISTIIFYFTLGFNLTELMLLIIFIVIYSLFISIIGTLINLKFPKLDFIHPVAVVKQSLSVFISIFIPIIVISILIALGNVFEIDVRTAINISFGIIVVLDFVLLYVLQTKGVKMFKKL